MAEQQTNEFRFLDPGRLIDGDLELVLVETIPGDPARGWVPEYRFEMRPANQRARTGPTTVMGELYLRTMLTERLTIYGGHIAYDVHPQHRGHHYAARGVQLLFPLARAHGLAALLITCDPRNTASRRTCEIAGAELVDILPLPAWAEEAKAGRTHSCRYRIRL